MAGYTHLTVIRVALATLLSTTVALSAVLPVRRYTTSDGLARDSVHCIIKDKNSFLWFATGEGISRFDGYGFTNYRVTDGLPDRDVRSIVQAQDGSFLVATGGGAARFDPYGPSPTGRFTVYAVVGSYKTKSVESVVDAGGAVWIGTDAGLFTVRESNIQAFPLLSDRPEPRVSSMVRDVGGNLWVGTSGGLFVVKTGLSTRQVTSIPVSSMLADGPGVLAATSKGLFKVEYGTEPLEVEKSIRTRRIKSLLRSRDGSLWVGTDNGVGQLVPGASQVRWLGEKEGFAKGDTQALAEGVNGDVWVGYDGAGAVRISASGFLTYGEHDGLPPGQIASMTLDHDGRLVVATSLLPGLNAYRLENGRFEHQNLGLDSRFYPASWMPWHQILLSDKRGTWWTASSHGLLQLMPPRDHGRARLISSHTVSDGLPADDVAHVFEDSKGNIWFSTLPIVAYPQQGRESGLGVWEKKTGRIRTFTEADGLPPLSSFAILYLFEDHAGQMWIGLYRTGVARYRNGRFQVFTPTEGIPSGGIRYIYEDHGNHLWLGSGRGGLGRIDDPAAEGLSIKRFSTANGLASDEIQAITEDNFGRIYAGTGFGVDRIDPGAPRIVHYTKADGLAEGEVQDALRDQSGDLWFGTYNGVSRLHPQPDSEPRPLPTMISSVKVNGRLVPTSLGAEEVTLADLPPGANGVEIEFLTLATSGPENLLYQYRLEGAATPWSSPTSTRSVLYNNLRAGYYVLQVRSVGAVANRTATVRFKVLPHFWETWRFLTFAVAALFGILYALRHREMAHLVGMQQMRTRIANDLHDDIGSGLSKIVILSEVAQREDKDSQVAALDRIAETSREVLNAVGDLVWATNASKERIEDLVRRMRFFATQLFEAKDVEFRMHVIDLPEHMELSPEVLRQLYLIFKEAVNNAAKHSQCSQARVTLRFERGILTMEIVDNGIGFKPEMKPDRHGLQSLKIRAATLGGTIKWRCEQGTTVEVRVPLRV
jgi:ligand-binding sensor domain-containing protein/signal transduction histidine kinase